MKRVLIIVSALTAIALGFRMFAAVRLANDAPNDGRIYSQIARNVLERGVYSIEEEEPFDPTFIRVPGYPLFLAGVYRAFGIGNDRAVLVIQAVVDTTTCWLAGLLAFNWAPACWPVTKRRRAALLALALAAVCPFGVIYVGTILTETWAVSLAVGCALLSTLALKSPSTGRAAVWWLACGLLGGVLTMFRPEGGLFVAGVGATLVLAGLKKFDLKRLFRKEPGRSSAPLRTFICGTMLSLGFALVLTPWTIRNARVFGLFQPLAPANAAMPGQFFQSGYTEWALTWIRDQKHEESTVWTLDVSPIKIDEFPDYAFDSAEERTTVEALLDQYNNPRPAASARQPPANAADSGNPSTDNASDDGEPDDSEAPGAPEQSHPEMTPDIDSRFAEIARARIARHPIRSRVVMPLRRAISMWFDPHAQYYPFEGDLFPLSALDREQHQQYWLPLFTGLTMIYTAIGLMGLAVMWRNGAHRFVLLFGMIAGPRILLLSVLEYPEPRYVVMLFAFIAVCGGIAVAAFEKKRGKVQSY